MKSNNTFILSKFNRFNPGMVHFGYPKINVIKLEAGPITSWTFSAKIGPYTVNAGYADKTLLYEGKHNQDMLHIGFILEPEYSAIAEAHKYNGESLSVDYGSVSIHEIFPANMSWGNIYAPIEIMMNGINFPSKRINESPHMIIGGYQKDLIPLIHIINHLLKLKPNTSIIKENIEEELQTAIYDLLTIRMTTNLVERPFVEGDKYKMHLLEKTHKLALDHMYKTTPISLDDICRAAKMKPRTLQKYFQETYGMGPTEYFRIRRLNNAHADLLDKEKSVSEIALRWKFTHLGRFSAQYQKMFGELPSEVSSPKS